MENKDKTNVKKYADKVIVSDQKNVWLFDKTKLIDLGICKSNNEFAVCIC